MSDFLSRLGVSRKLGLLTLLGALAVLLVMTLDLVEERGAFSILDPYLRLSAAGERVLPHDVTGALWLEIGTPERLEAARRAMGTR